MNTAQHPPTSPFSIAFLGGGNMAQAMVGGLIAQDWAAGRLGVWERDEARSAALKEQWGIATHTRINAALLDYAVWLLAVKPQDLPSLLLELKPHWQSAASCGQAPLVISIAAGASVDRIASTLSGAEAEKLRLVRVMPNTPASVGQAMSGAYATPSCTPLDRAHTQQLLSAMGQVVWVEQEAQMHAITAISGSGTAYYFYFTECLANAALALGLPADTAQILARQTLIGAGALAAKSPLKVSDLCTQVTSKGGTTEQALLAFAATLPSAVQEATEAANARSMAMSQL